MFNGELEKMMNTPAEEPKVAYLRPVGIDNAEWRFIGMKFIEPRYSFSYHRRHIIGIFINLIDQPRIIISTSNSSSPLDVHTLNASTRVRFIFEKSETKEIKGLSIRALITDASAN